MQDVTADRLSARSVAVVVGLAGVAGLLILLELRVPWHPVPGGAPAPVPAADVFSPAELTRMEAYAAGTRPIGWSSLTVSLAVSILLGATPLGARLVRRLPGPWWCQVVLGGGLVVMVGRLCTLPLSLLLRRWRLDYGLTRQGIGGFLVDVSAGLAVSTVATVLVLLVTVGCARRWRRVWPAVAGLLLALLTLGASYGYPVVVEPVFNDFRALPAGSLRSGILRLADTEGVTVDRVLVADASRRTTTLNAYVSGFGRTRRVVVYDNLVEGAPPQEVLSVVAHELSHARHDDVLVGSLMGAAGALVGVGVLGALLGGPSRRGRRPDRPEVVPLVLALAAVAVVLAAPAQNAVSRRIEARADVEALMATGDPVAFESLQRALALRALSDPTPPRWSQLWFGSHPTVLERIAVARKWQGWRAGSTGPERRLNRAGTATRQGRGGDSTGPGRRLNGGAEATERGRGGDSNGVGGGQPGRGRPWTNWARSL